MRSVNTNTYRAKLEARVYNAHRELYNLTTGNNIPADDQASVGRQLYQAWRKIERKAHRLAERMCDDPNLTESDIQRQKEALKATVRSLYSGNIPNGFLLNWDPRGYACKIEGDVMKDIRDRCDFPTDWGGYGLLACSLED